MMPLAKSTFDAVIAFVPNFRLDGPANIARKCTLLAFPLILVLGAANIPAVSGGPLSYATCMVMCCVFRGGDTAGCALLCSSTKDPRMI